MRLARLLRVASVCVVLFKLPGLCAFSIISTRTVPPTLSSRTVQSTPWLFKALRNSDPPWIKDFRVPVLLRDRRLQHIWEGDDRRWAKRLARRIFRVSFGIRTATPARDIIILLNIIMYTYQGITTFLFIRSMYPSFWPSQAWSMFADSFIDSRGTLGPLTRDFLFSPYLGRRQPHRFVTSGFLHGGILHLCLNMSALTQMPTWLETGLGWQLFSTTYLVGIITGNLFHQRSAMDEFLPCLGSSGGIVALLGLSFVALGKMGNKPASAQILRSIGALLLIGFMFPSVSNASHVGGFLAGCVMGLLFSPGYRKSYSLRRKNTVQLDTAPRDFRQVMGFGIVPKKDPPLPLWTLWAVALVYASTNTRVPNAVLLIWKGLCRPGSVSTSRMW